MSSLVVRTNSLTRLQQDDPDSPLELRRDESRPIESALAAVTTFFRPSADAFYLDPQSGFKYQTPSSHCVLRAMVELREEGGYRGVGVNKNQRFRNLRGTQEPVPCDVFYFVKADDQLGYERGEWGWFRSGIWGDGIQRRQVKQQEILRKIAAVLRRHCTDLGYETFLSHTSQRPIPSFFSENDGPAMDAFILYHKRVPQATSSARLPFSIPYPTIVYLSPIGLEQVLILARNKENLDFFIYSRGTEKAEKISEIEAPFPYKSIPDWQLKECLRQSCFRVASLSDGALKLHIQFRLLGGMMSAADRQRCSDLGIGDSNVSDAELTDNMLRAIAKDSYSSIAVQTLEAYMFRGTNVPKKVREIRVTVQSWEWFVHLMHAIAAQPIRGINGNRLMSAILGSSDPRDVEAMRKAYQKNFSLKIYASYDLENLYLDDVVIDPSTARAEAFQQAVVAPVRERWCVVS